MTTATPYPYFNYERSYLGAGADDVLVPPSGITKDEFRILKALRAQLLEHTGPNKEKNAYYEARQIVKHMDIAVPRNMADIGTAVGWCGIIVDALDERVDFLGWTADDDNLNGLDLVYVDNDLGVYSNNSHIDSFTTGVSFVSVGNDEDLIAGKKSGRQIVCVESSSTATVFWDYRKRRSLAGLSQTTDGKGNVMMESLYLQDSTIVFARESPNDSMTVLSRDDHDLGRCFMTRLVNRPRPFQLDGRSEITVAARYYTDAAVRTMLGMEVNREFYTAPQRFVLNARPEDFGVSADMSPEQKFRRGLSLAMGLVNIVPPRPDNTEGDPPSVVEMKPAPPTPYIEQVKAYSIQMSSESGLPATLFGFITDNPTSADSIVKSEYRLTRRASRRINSFGTGWKEVALLSLLARDGDADIDFLRRVKCKFANPMLPTPAATADEIGKMIAAKVLVPDSNVTYELYGRLDDQMIKRLDKDKLTYEAKLQREAMREAEMQAAVVAARQPAAGSNGQPSPRRRPAAEVGAR